MGNVSVSDIFTTQLAKIPVAGGDVMHVMKCIDPGFAGFGEAYFSALEHGAVKGWKRHLRMTLNLVVPIGFVRFVFVDADSNIQCIDVGYSNYIRITVPPGIWFGFQDLSNKFSLILNVADIVHDPDEVERKSLSEINYDWGVSS